MSENKKTAIVLLCSIGTLGVTAFFWENTFVTIALLFILSLFIFYVENNRSVVLIYLTAFVFGPLSEAWLIQAGAWQYATPHLLGFPLWLPFVWGNASLMFNRINIYLRYISKKV
jgi:hypothetical protein